MIVSIFENINRSGIFPISKNKLALELRCGAYTNYQRIINCIDEDVKIQVFVPDVLKDFIKEKFPNFIVNPNVFMAGYWLNGQALWSKKKVLEIELNKSYTYNDNPLALYSNENISLKNVDTYLKTMFSVSQNIDIPFIENIWDLLYFQSDIIISDANDFFNYKSSKIHPSVILENPEDIFLGENSEISAGVVLDAKDGPIIIEKDVHIDIGALLQGPIYIGKKSVINPGAKLRKNITIGPFCKLGGEIQNSIIQGYSNKQHGGYLGHSYIGEWVNLGANTNTSNLKNNYSNIRLEYKNKKIDTGCKFLGSIINDYVRTGISTMLNTGTIIDYGANVFGSGFHPKYISPFKWGERDKTDLKKFIDIIISMKKRRGKELGSAEKEFIYYFYKNII